MSEKKILFDKLIRKRERDSEVLMDWEYRGIWETAIKKYSGTAHFVYELLQNADDANATWVEFDLQAEGLWFKHNGSVRFSISDVATAESDTKNGRLGHLNAITAIGNSNKPDQQKIGKFGIGFKAVFAYSHTPHIYDESFNFRLKNFIVPEEISPNLDKAGKGETVFYFPFNHPEKGVEEAYHEIEEKLDNLFQPVLFLNSLKKIKWHSLEKKGEYHKAKPSDALTFGDIEASLVSVTNNKKREKLWIFSKNINDTINANHKIQVAFFILDEKLEIGYTYEAFCFFPTKEETKLGFVIQAPFLLTDSREGIKTGEVWNESLILQLSELTGEAICCLKQIGVNSKNHLIDDSILEIIPFDEHQFHDNKARISFKPFYSSIKSRFKTEQIIPGKNGKYFKSAKSYWASDPELTELFSDAQISELMENPNSGWVFISKGQKQLNQANKALETYISGIVQEVLDPKKLLRRITAKFIESQSDRWLIKFYAYLGGRKHLWDDRDKLALKRPILLNQERKAVVPFNETLTTANVFLPSDTHTTYDTIFAPLLQNESALDFFKSLGIQKPDLKSEIFKSILPLYQENFDYGDTETIKEHFSSFLTYYENASSAAQSEFIRHLTPIDFIATKKVDDPDNIWFCKGVEVYFNDARIHDYFSDFGDVHFLDEDFYVEFIHGEQRTVFFSFLTALGVVSVPRLMDIPEKVTSEVKERFGLEHFEISNKYYYDQTIIDKDLHGLDHLVANITLQNSEILWNYLLFYCQGRSITSVYQAFKGIFTYYPKGHSYKSGVARFISSVAATLHYDAWLFDKEGNAKVPSELTREQLNPIYNLDDPFADVLLEFLSIHNPDANLNLTDSQKQALLIGRKFLEEGITQNEIDEFLRMLAERKAVTHGPTFKETEVNVSEEEIDTTLSSLRKGLKKKRQDSSFTGDKNPLKVEKKENVDELELQDQDDYTKPSIDLQKKIDRLKEQTEAQIEDLTRIEKLYELANSSEKYSFAWFKALLELESLNSHESNSQGKQISIQFTRVEKEENTERTLILKHPSRYIPQSIEDIGDIQLKLYQGDDAKTVTVEVVNVKEYTLRAKLKKSADLTGIELPKITRAVIDVKNPVFLLDELRKAFFSLKFDDEFNLQTNLTSKIRFIFGPPGTGKTTYLAEKEIIALMQRNENNKVLVLAPTNKAADVLTKRIMEKMGVDESYYSWLIRFGTTADSELENNVLVKDKSFDIRSKPKNTTITTVARFAYDYFQPNIHDERLHLKFLEWDYIIVDEASMVNLAAIVYILYQKPTAQFIIAGDPFQIQPITQIEQWKDMNIYDMVQLKKFTSPQTIPHQYEIVNLTKQYRSIPSIGSIFSHFTYEGTLEHHRKFSEQKQLNLRIDKVDFKDINIIKFPVSKYESIFKPNTLNKSNYQVYSALFTVEFASRLALHLNSQPSKFKIGIICPYKAQATLIEKIIAQQAIDTGNTEIHIGTIHGFQGDECDIIIAIFNPGFYISKSPNSFLNKQNVLNVSISRARDFLFILMPDDHTPDVENLYRIKRIEKLISKHAEKRHSVYEAEVIEREMFGHETYVYDNSFATSHQSVNVYSKPEKKYEVRCEETAVDVQIRT